MTTATSQEDLDALRATVRDFLEAVSGEEAARELIESEAPFDPKVWAQLSGELRLAGLAIPEAYGGDGFGLVELGVVLEEMGRSLLCAPFFSSVVLAATTLLAAGDDVACARYLPGIAAGTTTAALAVTEADGAWGPRRITTVAEETSPGQWSLTGRKSFVIDGTTADLLLVVARAGVGLSLFAVDRQAPGVRAEALRSLDATRAQAQVTFEAAPATRVGEDGAGECVFGPVLDVASVCLAAEQAGGARRVLETAAEYARTRHQFGRPIGSFQAVKHKCADMLVHVELAEATAREAARLHDEDPAGLPAAAAAAHACCSRAYLFAAMENIQVHGGIGFTWEHSAHLHFRRAKSAQLLFGGPAAYHERLLAALGV
ncbi:acyl-CoA dehydrogenase [Amycolatopsis balhimycina DSM 5908]|uniref:Acyl-CoA dehydrogenase n=1 Tax=Amycolatopsis balhimycina DSM 5908 TaxID=1081091 RepID=A0A428WVD5_AMYBA|nr:acyl-CoA dehydrogenase family protein [Amycolatopsis balhimycina]RSM47041.1 acyl-CoA dehydrogenase [Amycolatopsis balhimycina DSM 5908]